MERQLEKLFSNFLKEKQLHLSFEGNPVDVLEVSDPAGFLPLLYRQAKALSDVCDPRNGFLQGAQLVEDEYSLTGERLEFTTKELRDRTEFLLFMLEALAIAADLTPGNEGVIELTTITSPKLPDIFERLGITTQPLSTFSEPRRAHQQLD